MLAELNDVSDLRLFRNISLVRYVSLVRCRGLLAASLLIRAPVSLLSWLKTELLYVPELRGEGNRFPRGENIQDWKHLDFYLLNHSTTPP